MKLKDKYQRNRGAQEMTEPSASVDRQGKRSSWSAKNDIQNDTQNHVQKDADGSEDQENTRKENEKLSDEKISEYVQTLLENNDR